MNLESEQLGPGNRIHFCMTSVREFIIIYGGYDCDAGTECNELWRYNTINGLWKRYETPIEIKDTCLSCSICPVGNLVYIFGGSCFCNEYRQTNSIVSFDIDNASWETVFPHTYERDLNTPPPMCGNLLIYHNGCLYIVGTLQVDQDIHNMYMFCLKTSAWSHVIQKSAKPIFEYQIIGTVYKNQ
ncbi:hypothetical protein RF11_13002 [Thelohanellus kitauei]|uniref:Kelch domain-containing protein 10 n=1 Tax=Thelohanellus kitauei TaxID=669202 RepID=A0A0C2NER1_THEKT|nr:hypothetical protein RF11_13002 [Thelohanellus kitauei]